MKKLVFSFLFLVAFALACSKSQDNVISYGDDNLNLKLRNVNWYTTCDSSEKGVWFGGIGLKIAGYTNADTVFIRTNGDGEISFSRLNLNNKKEFSEDIGIAFHPPTRVSLKGKETSTSTTLLAIKNNDTLKVDLESGKLQY